MSVLQSEAINWLKSQIGQHLDYDNAYGQQCFDFFNFYYKFITGQNPYASGYQLPSAKDIWNVTDGNFVKFPDSNTLVPQPGDIAIYGAAWGAGNGHVEVVESNDANGCWFIGENEHNNPNEGVVRVYRTWAQMRGLLGVMHPNWLNPEPLYTIEYRADAQFKVKPGMRLWDLSLPTFEDVCNHPIGDPADDNRIITVKGLLRHRNIPQYEYYVEDINSPHGWNTLDVDPYTPPAKPLPPAAPLPVPKAEQYDLKTTVMYFNSAADARTHTNAKGTKPNGTYIVVSRDSTAVNLVKQNTDSDSFWINDLDNVVPEPTPVAPAVIASVPVVVISTPKPAPVPDTEAQIKSTFLPFNKDGTPIWCTVKKDVLATDLVHHGQAFTVHRLGSDGLEREVPVYGTFKANGRYYAKLQLKTDKDNYYMYGIALNGPNSLAPYLEDTYNVSDRILYGAEKVYDTSMKTIEGIFKVFRLKK